MNHYDADDLLMLSALQHLLFCERQCALIHIEQAWSENAFTVRGESMHERAHEGGTEYRDGIRIERGIPLRSLKLGLIGKSDVVEFHKRKTDVDGKCVTVPFPVEYKLGKSKKNRCDEVQLCAQAICLEEMLDVCVPEGALFYGKTKRRQEVVFDDELRRLTIDTAAKLHSLVEAGLTPLPIYEKMKCDHCSLAELCFPKSNMKKSPITYMEAVIDEETT